MVFSQNITPTHLDVRWGADFHARVDILQHATRLPEGNPVFVFRHGGGGMLRDKRLPWIAGGSLNLFANWIMQQSALPCDFWSIESPQCAWGTPISAAHLSTTRDEPVTRPVVFPENVEWVKTFYQWANRHAVGGLAVPELGATLGHTAGDYIGCGGSFGAFMQALAQFSGPRPPGAITAGISPGGRFGPYATSSSVRGLILFEMPPDIRNLAGQEQIYWAVLGGMFGTHTLVEWNRVPTWLKAAASPLAYVLAGQTRYVPPTYVIHENVGNGLKPYGDPATGAGADVHDGAQNATLGDALTAAGVPNEAEVVELGEWEDETLGPPISQRVFDWARGVLNR